ncbi:MAG TPA: helix-turn-helix transcriptional regulator [Thermoanaerobaculia bacterium]|nr:helix-turn-helix transcriptional regulator [Thermoanaerobaculia bacterium]
MTLKARVPYRQLLADEDDVEAGRLVEAEEVLRELRRSTGNVFTDLGFSEEEAENLKIRADLMIELTKLIEAQELTQAAAARLLGVTQPRISDLMRGKIDRFSVDSLIEMLGHAGARVSFVVTRRDQVA